MEKYGDYFSIDVLVAVTNYSYGWSLSCCNWSFLPKHRHVLIQ